MKVVYPENQKIIDHLRKEVSKACGEKMWKTVIQKGEPNGNMEQEELSVSMQVLTEALEKHARQEVVRAIFHCVKHALDESAYSWARELFLKYNDIDRFAAAVWESQMAQLRDCLERDELFYDQPIDEAAFNYARSIPELFYGRRTGNEITAVAVPYRLAEYLKTSDGRKKRYYACHCPFARASILKDKTVSTSLCHCSMGHVKLFWESVFGVPLTGRVEASALQGDTQCRFVFVLPDKIVEQFTGGNAIEGTKL